MSKSIDRRALEEKSATLGFQINPYTGFVVTCKDDDSVIHCKTLGECEEYIDDCQLSESELQAKYE